MDMKWQESLTAWLEFYERSEESRDYFKNFKIYA